jgi:predicted peptidase
MYLENVLPDKTKLEQYRFFLLAVQIPEGDPPWYRIPGPPPPDEPATVLMEIVSFVETKYPIDRDRVCLSGLSAGGTACWEIGMRYPGQFAAIVPMSSAGVDESNYERLSVLKSTPIWAFHSKEDPAIPIQGDRKTAETLRHLGGDVRLTEVEGAEHNCTTAAFRNYGAMEWMLSNVRGHEVVPFPLFHKSWVYIAIASLPVLAWLTIRIKCGRRSAA